MFTLMLDEAKGSVGKDGLSNKSMLSPESSTLGREWDALTLH